MMCIKLRFPESVYSVLAVFLIVGLWLLGGCSDDNSTGPVTPQVAKISISPEEATLETEEQIDFSVFALTENGDTIDTDDIDIEWQWWSTDPNVFDVEPGGLATGKNSGEAFCVVEATVSVSQSIAEERDIRYAGFAFSGNKKKGTDKNNIKLLLDESERLENKKAAFKENRLRFTGRDSAIVFVF